MDIQKRIRQLMDERHWTEYKLAKKCNLSQSTISNIFLRNTTPTVSTIEAICNCFGITLAQFFAEGDLVELDQEQREFFDQWVLLTNEQKQALLKMIEMIQ